MRKRTTFDAHLIATTALLVLLIAGVTGAALALLRGMHDKAADAIAARTVLEQGHHITARLAAQCTRDPNAPTETWTPFTKIVRAVFSVEDNLQYVSVSDDDVVVYHEQSGDLETGTAAPRGTPDASIEMSRRLLRVHDKQVPVVVFRKRITLPDGRTRLVETALRREAVDKERGPTAEAIASMFRFSLLTIVVAFVCCILLVIWMMRRELVREKLRREQEHLAFSGVLSNGIVHDFRNPMSSIRLDVQMLGREIGKGAECQQERVARLADRVRTTLDRMDKVFQEFLCVARPDSDAPVETNLVQCVNAALDLLAARLEHAGVQARVHADDGPVVAIAYEASLRRALVNVITNAEQFSAQGKTIDVTIASEGDRAHIDICDRGPGIDRRIRKSVFDMFVTSRPEGTGLGLFLARSAVRRSNGTITAKDRPGGGTCIRIELKRA